MHFLQILEIDQFSKRVNNIFFATFHEIVDTVDVSQIDVLFMFEATGILWVNGSI